jgi:hypothetical protein
VRPTRLPLPADRPWSEEWKKCNDLLRALVADLERERIRGLHLVPWKDLLGDDNEATVDGIHPTDLGFSRMAAVIGGAVRRSLRNSG